MNRADQLIDRLIGYLNSTEVFLKEQVPSFIEEIIRYYTVYYWTLSITAILQILLCLFVIHRIYINDKNNEGIFYDSEVILVAGAVGSFFASIISICELYTGVHRLIQIYLAPKLFLLDYLRGLK